MINKLLELNENLLNKSSNEEEYKKHLLIKKILSTKDCFLNMNIEQAYSILRDLKFKDEDIKKIYIELI